MGFILNYDSFINEQQLRDEELLESINFRELLQELHAAKNKKKIAKMLAIGLLSIYSISKVNAIITNDKTITPTEKVIIEDVLEEVKDEIKDPTTLRMSQNGWDHIRKYETYKETAYNLGDGKITIGYGHAEPEKTSTYQVGDKMSKADANKLFIKDVNIAAKGVRRIFKEWKAKGIKMNITQNQYDVLVSLAFNMGIQGLRTSDFIQAVKKGDMNDAAEKLKTVGTNPKFSGLKPRRNTEYDIFTKL
jgi:GH24 family phage-related lysozyme (muramidase)